MMVLCKIQANINNQKMLAIGKRCKIESEPKNREMKLHHLQSLLKQRENELHEMDDQHKNFVRVIAEQEEEMQKIRQS